jgi:biopolymer transport protein TolQ
MSIVSWAIIARKYVHLKIAQRQSVTFLQSFWESKALDAIYQAAERTTRSPVSQVFRAGYVELSKVTQRPREDAAMVDRAGGIENVERALQRAQVAELTQLEATIPFLGTTASAAPFVGLFGTVWGIMNAFRGLSTAQSSSIQAVAPGISEALIANADAFLGPGILVPTRNAGLFRWCLENGLRVVQPLTLMTLGFYNEPAGAYLPSILY